MTTAELESVRRCRRTPPLAGTAGRCADIAATTATTGTDHLTPERWAAANRHLIRKALAEFSHERILVAGTRQP